jgi:hypothetical protein
MQLRQFIFLFSILLLNVTSFSQKTCGTRLEDIQVSIEERELFRKQSSFKNTDDTLHIAVSILIIQHENGQIPFHLQRNQIESMFSELDSVLLPIGIDLEICNAPTYIYDDELFFEDIFDKRYYLENIYKVPQSMFLVITGNAHNSAGFSAGSYIGVNYTGFNKATLLHEFGHSFSLPHTHQGGDELVDRTNCTTTGDYFCDTPADPNTIGRVDGNCNYTGNARDANGDPYSPPVSNYMSYAPGFCTNEFSEEQKEAIRSRAKYLCTDALLTQYHLNLQGCVGDTVWCIQKTEISECTGSLGDGSGLANYGNSTNCEYLLETENQSDRIKVDFLFFETEAGKDVLYIYDGNSSQAPLIGSFSGSSLPPRILASSNALFLVFVSDGEINLDGWALEYDCFEGVDLELILPYGQYYDYSGPFINVNATVVNNGTLESVETTGSLRLYDIAFAINEADTTVYFQVPAIPARDTIQIGLSINVCNLEQRASSKGSYRVTGVVDYLDMIEESIEENNVVESTIDDTDPVCSSCSSYTLNSCSDSISDGSGQTEDYEANQACEWLIQVNPSDQIIYHLTYSDIAGRALNGEPGDSLIVYDGELTTDPILEIYKDKNNVTDTLTSSSNKLLVKFFTDSYNRKPSGTGRGWKLKYHCSSISSISENTENNTIIYPNPSKNGFFHLKTPSPERINVYDISGKKVLTIPQGINDFSISEKGIYFLGMESGKHLKIIVH